MVEAIALFPPKIGCQHEAGRTLAREGFGDRGCSTRIVRMEIQGAGRQISCEIRRGGI